MSRSNQNRGRHHATGKFFLRTLLALLSLFLVLYLALQSYLSTQLPARQISRMLSAYLHQPVTVTGLSLSGGTVYLKRVSLANPAGFPASNLATVDSLAIAPSWSGLVTGRRRFRLVGVEGLSLDLIQNRSGVWNYAQLRTVLAAKKPSPEETLVRHLSISNASIRINGRELRGISLQMFNLATKGSLSSRVQFGFEDRAGNRFQVTGTARPGRDAAFHIAVSAPALSLKGVAQELRLEKYAPMLEQGRGSLALDVLWQKGAFRAQWTLAFSRIRAAALKRDVAGTVTGEGDYDMQSDQARVSKTVLAVDGLANISATGRVDQVRQGRNFVVDLSVDPVPLRNFAFLLPEAERTRNLLGGNLAAALRVSGSARQGVSSAGGVLLLHDGMLVRDGRLLIEGMEGRGAFSRKGETVQLTGKLSTGPDQHALVRALEAPFTVALSSKLKLLWAEFPSLAAAVNGVPIRGRAEFRPAAPEPVTAELLVPEVRVSLLRPLLPKGNIELGSGTASVALRAHGRTVREMEASASIRCSRLEGTVGREKFGVADGTAEIRGRRSAGHLWAAGQVQLRRLALKDNSGDVRFSFTASDRSLLVEQLNARLKQGSFTVARLTTQIPVKEMVKDGTRYPLLVEWVGSDMVLGAANLSGLSGRMHGFYYTSGKEARWLDGNLKLAGKELWWQGKRLGAPAADLLLSKSGARGSLNGEFLGGTLQGKVSFDPFALHKDYLFQLMVRNLSLARAGTLLAGKGGVTFSEGVVDADGSGTFTAARGMECTFKANGKKIALVDPKRGGKTLISGAGMGLGGTWAGKTLHISDAVVSAGPGALLKLKGEVNDPFTPKRQGTIAFNLPETRVRTLLEPFLNALPRFLQEATTDGTVQADGNLKLSGGGKEIQGGISIKNGRIEIPSKKLIVDGVNGRIPISVTGKTMLPPPLSYSRHNYPQLLQRWRSASGATPSLTVEKVSLGTLDLGRTTVRFRTSEGTELGWLRSSLYQGSLLGRLSLSLSQGVSYRGDFLVNNLSLKQLCAALPQVKGYIAGRVDGVVSLSGFGKTLADITGFVDLWAHKGGGEKMVVSKEFLQRLSGKRMTGFFFSMDRPYDSAEISAILQEGFLTFQKLDIEHTNFFGVRDLNVSVAQTQNRIALDHLLGSISQAASRGKPAAAAPSAAPAEAPAAAPPSTEFKWEE